jgi:hypothetical protein
MSGVPRGAVRRPRSRLLVAPEIHLIEHPLSDSTERCEWVARQGRSKNRQRLLRAFAGYPFGESAARLL